MKNFDVTGSWPILIFVALFLVLPLSTLGIPGVFEFISVILGLITVGIVGLIGYSFVRGRASKA